MNGEDILKPNSLVFSDIDSSNSPITVDNPNFNDTGEDIKTMWAEEGPLNYKNKQNKKLKRVYNLSVVDIAKKIAKTFLDILDDLTSFATMKNKKYSDVITIFIKNERLVYIGISLILVAFITFLISASSESSASSTSSVSPIRIKLI
tara:strand:+ start:7735 stop:8178 length:444 start_codon:yes stop_codon:yes gene_type:complete